MGGEVLLLGLHQEILAKWQSKVSLFRMDKEFIMHNIAVGMT